MGNVVDIEKKRQERRESADRFLFSVGLTCEFFEDTTTYLLNIPEIVEVDRELLGLVADSLRAAADSIEVGEIEWEGVE